MSGFVYKVQVNGQTLIKKEIPGPDTIDEFLYEVNALNALRFSKSIIEFYGVVVDDDDQVVKGLLISYAEQGALIDVIYDSQENGGQELPWQVREKWARQIVRGLSDIHETGFVQGDFTLSNIVIDDFGNAKIIDINRRGCPVGWEPPEATPLIDSNQRISMYIGVKSDLYQLGMVLWALATLEDEPEAHRRPLRLKPELDVPPWYRRIVETCLHENPRHRLQATALLNMFPDMPYDDVHDERELPSISVHDGTSFQTDVADERYGPPEIRTVEPRASWPYSGSNTQGTSPSFSDEPYYPPRGRSPPKPLPEHHDFYNSPYNDRNVMWVKSHDAAVVDDNPTAEEAIVGTPGDPEDATVYANMEEELEQIEARLLADLKYEQTQAAGGNSQAQDVSLKTVVVEPLTVADGEDEKGVLLSEDESDVPASTHDPIPDGSSNGTPVAEMLQPVESTVFTAEKPAENVDASEVLVDDSADGVVALEGDQTETPDIENHEEPTQETEPNEMKTETDDLGTAYTYDRADTETEAMSTRTTEAKTAPMSDITPREDLPLANPSGLTGVGPADDKTGEAESAMVLG
jgi:serine/threonine protein kinase